MSQCMLAVATLLVGVFGSATVTAVTINPEVPTGPVVKRWGWDLKGTQGLANNIGKAQDLYSSTGANLVRIPIFVDAHFSSGAVDATRYQTVLNSIQNIKAVSPDVEVFASLKLSGGDTFIGPASEPGWVTAGTPDWPFDPSGSIFSNQSNRPNPEHYSQLVADFFSYFRSQGVEIDYLGINNETEGALGVNRYIGTVDLLKPELTSRGFDATALKLIAPDSFGPNTTIGVANDLANQGRLDTADIFGSHYYSSQNNHTREGWVEISDASGGRDAWFTEAHINPSNNNNGGTAQDNIARMRAGLGMVFSANTAGGGAVDAQGDLIGANSFVWWGGGPGDSQIDNVLKQNVIKSMVGGQPVATTPGFAEQGEDDEPLYQAYRRGNQVTLWLANPGAEQINLAIDLAEGRLLDAVSVASGSSAPGTEYWQGCSSPSGPCNGAFGNNITPTSTGLLALTVNEDRQGLVIDALPYNSIARLHFTLQQPGDLNADGLLDENDIEQFKQGYRLQTADGDVDLDGDTDLADWVELRTAFMNSGGSGPFSVPEPVSLSVVATLSFAAITTRLHRSATSRML